MKAHVKKHHGTPTLYLDGEPTFAGIHLLGGLDPNAVSINQGIIRAFAANNVHINSIEAVEGDWCGPRPGNPNPYDFSKTASRFQQVLDADPQALFLLRMGFETYWPHLNWWNELHLEELEILSDGRKVSASYASQVWQSDVREFLKAYIEHLRSVGLYDRVIAYQVGVGTCGEWIKSWSSMSTASGDYGEPMRRQFRAWLRKRYNDDVVELRTAWADTQVTFDNAEAPSGEEQATPTHLLFRDPKREQKTIDFYACYAETCADALIGFCQTIKEATQGDKLAGAFYGYLMELAWNDCFFSDAMPGREAAEVSTIQRSGHLGLQKALRSPYLDFLVSPYGYAFRGLGGDGLPMQPTESLRLHGKIYLLEEDTLMHNNFDPGGRMHPVTNSIAIYQRNFAQVLTHGIGVTWWESNVFSESPLILPEARAWYRRFQQLGNWALQLDRRPSAEVAVLLDDESFFYEGNRNDIDLPAIWQQRVISLNRFGAPHDVYLLNDLLEGNLPPYQLYIFLNAFHLDEKRRAALKEIVCRENKTALWLYAPGYINEDAPGAANDTRFMTDLTCFRFGKGSSYWAPFMHITDFNHPITQGVPQDLFWGTNRSLAPIFHLEDPEATVLGEVVYGLGRCRAGLGVKRLNPGSSQAWTSIYVATPNVPPQVLRGIARFADVHLYSEEGDVLYATPQLLSVHTVAGGARTFRLPQRVEAVYDLYHDRLIAQDATQFAVQLPPASTALYYTGRADLLMSWKPYQQQKESL
jgi:hypothetical protein